MHYSDSIYVRTVHLIMWPAPRLISLYDKPCCVKLKSRHTLNYTFCHTLLTVFFHIKYTPRFSLSAKQNFFSILISDSTPEILFYFIPKCVHPTKFASRMASPLPPL